MNLNSLSGLFREVPFTAQKAEQAKAGHAIELIHTLLHRRFKALLSFPVLETSSYCSRTTVLLITSM